MNRKGLGTSGSKCTLSVSSILLAQTQKEGVPQEQTLNDQFGDAVILLLSGL